MTDTINTDTINTDTINIEALSLQFAQRDAEDPHRYPAANISDLSHHRLLGASFPCHLGGRGWTLPEAARAVEIIARGSPSTALLWAMPLGFAGVSSVDVHLAPEEHQAGWSAQVEQMAAEYRQGRIFAACNSEKGAGGSLASTRTVAERVPGGQFRLTGDKILASFGQHANVFVSTAKLPPEQPYETETVEFFLVRTPSPGVEIMADWDGFGMRSTESQSVRYQQAAGELLGFPNYIDVVRPTPYFFCLFAAIPLGCAGGMLRAMAHPAPTSPALRLRLNEALMRYEALTAYLLETSRAWRPAAHPGYAAQVGRMKTYVSQESTRLCAELFALTGGSHYRESDPLARLLADSFAGTSLRPPLPLSLDLLSRELVMPEVEGSPEG
jgi:alkylation response protein AidB-like acyl-CoA dehydrogenase